MKCRFCGSVNLILIKDFIHYKSFGTNLPYAWGGEDCYNDDKVQVKIMACESCGLGFNATPLSDADLKNIYNNYYYISAFQINEAGSYNETIKIINEFDLSKDSKIVEIGCSEGYLLYLLKQNGYSNVMGIEPSNYADIGISYGLSIDKAFFHSSYFTDKVDLFVLKQVFEHFSDPISIFEAMVHQLSDSGIIHLETPNFTAYNAQHLFYYSYPFYEKLADKYGLKIIYVDDSYPCINISFAYKNSHYDSFSCQYSIGDVFLREIDNIAKINRNINNILSDIRKFIFSKKQIYWWGCGLLTTEYLHYMNINNIDCGGCDIIPVDINEMRTGARLPYTNNTVRLPSDVQHTTVEGIIVCTSFVDSVKKAMEEYNIKSMDILCLPHYIDNINS